MTQRLIELHRQLVKHEGLRLKPYRCTAGKLTIGVGRNLDDVGITQGEAMALLDNDIQRVEREVEQAFPWYDRLSAPRKNVVLNMVFNLGLARFRGFRNAIAAMQTENWADAAAEMLDSKWARQVGNRARELARQMETGEYQ